MRDFYCIMGVIQSLKIICFFYAYFVWSIFMLFLFKFYVIKYVAGGRWQVAGGRWQVAGSRWQVAGVRLVGKW